MPVKEFTIHDNIKWIDITEPSFAEVDALSKQYNLEPYIIKDSMDPEHLPKYETVNDINFLILRFYNLPFDKRIAAIQDLTSKLAIFYTDNFLITVHLVEIAFLEIIKRKFVQNSKCITPADIVIKIMWYTLESYHDPAQRLAEKVDFFEARLMLKGIKDEQIEDLYYIKRQASLSSKILLLIAEPINHFRAAPDDNVALQDVRDHHLKMITLYNQVVDDINNLMNLYMSFSAKKTNETMKVLTIFSVFFMPLTFIVGIYGMNFTYMPELETKWGYPASILLMVVITLVVYFWFRRKKWL